MAKTKRATRKELETVIKEIIDELRFLRQGFTAIDNYLGAYVQFKGDSIRFNDYLQNEMKKRQQEKPTETKPTAKDIKSAKKSRYDNLKSPPA